MPRKKLESPQVDEPRSSRSRKPTEKALALAQTEKIFSAALKPKTSKSSASPATVTTPKPSAPPKKPTSTELVIDLPKLTPSQIKGVTPPSLHSESSSEPPPEVSVKRGRGRPRKKTLVDDADSVQFDETNSMQDTADAMEEVKTAELVIDEDSCSSRSGSQDSGPFYGTVPETLELDTQVRRTAKEEKEKEAQATTSESTQLEHSVHPTPTPDKPLKKYPPARSRKIPMPIVDANKLLELTSTQIDLEKAAADINEINVEMTFQPNSDVDQPTGNKRGRPRKGESVSEKHVDRPAPTRKSLRSLRKDTSQEPEPEPSTSDEQNDSATSESKLLVSLDSIENDLLEASCRRMTIPITAMHLESDVGQLDSEADRDYDEGSMDVDDIPAPEYEHIDTGSPQGMDVEIEMDEVVVEEIQPEPEPPELDTVVVEKIVEKVKETPKRSSSRTKKSIESEKVVVETISEPDRKLEISKEEEGLSLEMKPIELKASSEKPKRSSSRTKKAIEPEKMEDEPIAEPDIRKLEEHKLVKPTEGETIVEKPKRSSSRTKKAIEPEKLEVEAIAKPDIPKLEEQKLDFPLEIKPTEVETIVEKPKRSSSRTKKAFEQEKVDVEPVPEKLKTDLSKQEIAKLEVEIKPTEVADSKEKSKRSSSRTKKTNEKELAPEKVETDPSPEISMVETPILEKPKIEETNQKTPVPKESKRTSSKTKRTNDKEPESEKLEVDLTPVDIEKETTSVNEIDKFKDSKKPTEEETVKQSLSKPEISDEMTRSSLKSKRSKDKEPEKIEDSKKPTEEEPVKQSLSKPDKSDELARKRTKDKEPEKIEDQKVNVTDEDSKQTSSNEKSNCEKIETSRAEHRKDDRRTERERKDDVYKKDSRREETRKETRKEDTYKDDFRKERSRKDDYRRDDRRRDDSRHRFDKKRPEESKDDSRKKDDSHRRRDRSDYGREKSSSSHSRDDNSDYRRDRDRSSYSRDDKYKTKGDHFEKDRDKPLKPSTPKQAVAAAPAPPKPVVLKDVDVMKMDDIMLEHKREKERARARKLQKEIKNKERIDSPKVDEGKATPIEETKSEENKADIAKAPIVVLQQTMCENTVDLEEKRDKIPELVVAPDLAAKDQEQQLDKKEKSKKEKSSKEKEKDKSRRSKKAEKESEDVDTSMVEPDIPQPLEIEQPEPTEAPVLSPPPPPVPTTHMEDVKLEIPQDEPPKPTELEINEITSRMSTTLEIYGPTTAECSAAIEYEMVDQIEKMSIVQPTEDTIVKNEESFTSTEVGLLTSDDTPMPEEPETPVTLIDTEVLAKKELSESIDDSENLRRSSRIKTISSSKQRTVGHGLVRDRDKLLKMMNESLTAERSSPNLGLLDDSGKPMKVKSRWRRSSELEMGLIDDTDEYMPDDDMPTKPKSDEETDPEKIKENERIVEEQLKMFQHIRENIFHCDRNVSKETRKMMCDCFLTREEIDRGELGCGEDCLNRLLMIECGQRCVVAERCTNKRFQKQQNSDVHVFRTEKKGCGIKASRVILPGDFIMEYVGEVLNSIQFEKRAHEYSKEKNKHYYFMALRSDCIIDATLKGNVSRFINHSCDPNAETQKWTVNGELRIGFFSVRTIMPGEEIVFDYQFQRYGKQAQKCFCEAENCRGWIGEEPDSDESELEEEEYEEEDADEEEKAAATAETDDKSLDQPAKKAPKPPRKPRVKVPKPDAKRSRKIRKDLLDDVGLDEEIDTLVRTGLKNQMHTLKLSRLMVRAESIAVRRRLLNLLLHGELPCRRLFLDYYGLRLLHGWMCGITSSNIIEILRFKLNLLEVLEVLPITNKTMLTDSKVISTVEGWITKKTAGAKKEFFTQDPSPTNDSSSNSSDLPPPPAVKQIDTEFLKNMPDLLKQSAAFVQDMDVEKLKQIMESCDKMKEQEREKELSEPKEVEKPPPTDDSEAALIEKINTLCRKLLASWETLKEVFKIPKKERIEQMKEHEREADMRYKALGLADEDDQNQQRYKSNPLRERRQIESFQQKNRDRPSDTRERHMSKHQRRHLFEVRVAQEEAEKRKHEMWLLHETTCLRFGLNPRQVAPQDIPGMMNVYTEQYYTMDHRPIPTPPSHAFLKFKKPPLSTNPADYILPFMDLPPMWKFAIDDRGRLYYYHIKIRVPQWEPPIKLLPLNNDGKVEDDSMSESETTDDDTSTTDTNDSSEEELEQKLQELQRAQEKRKKALADQGDDVANTIENLDTSIDADGDELFGNSFLLDRSMDAIIPSSKKRRRKRDGLVQERMISPRTEEDRAYGQMEMKRYRETKEKLRRRKEEARRKKAMAVAVSASTTADIPRIEDKPNNDDDDDEEDDANTGILDADAVDIEKTTKKKTIVDELEILRKSKPRKHSNVYEEWKKQELKMKMEKRRSAGKSSSKTAKRAKVSESIGSLDYNSEEARKIKDKFRVAIASVIVQHLGPYRKDNCEIGKITNNEDFKHLARKLTHFVMLKELKHNHNTIRDLVVTESVKTKAREFIKKYMAKYGDSYVRGVNEPDFKD